MWGFFNYLTVSLKTQKYRSYQSHVNEATSKYLLHKMQECHSLPSLVNMYVLGRYGEEGVMLFNKLWLLISTF